MNTVWSKYVQGINTLFHSRRLRFDDRFAADYMCLFDIDRIRPVRILEIGCGPGALAGAMHRWYPNAEITAIDRDSEFVRFASEKVDGVCFSEGDATALPFADGTFDVTISNTVAEHIEPSKFYGEQYRVLKTGGKCIVLSSRRGINIKADCISQESDFEREFWDRARMYDTSMEDYAVCKYPMSEAEMPAAMEKYGFRDVKTGYVTVNLTPDDPAYPRELAYDMINSNRHCALDAIDSVLASMPEHFTPDEIREMKRLTNEKYDHRLAEYDRGEKQWDTNVSVIMAVTGTK